MHRKGITKLKKCLVFIALAIFVFSLSASAAKLVQVPITGPDHNFTLFQAYAVADEGEGADAILGYNGFGDATITAVPGVLSFVPGGTYPAYDWTNFINAPSTVGPFIKNVTLTKVTGTTGQCSDVFPVTTVNQQGSPNIRVWWPLMYELPGTTWTLTVFYGTKLAYVDSANIGKPGAYAHTEVWTFAVDADLESMEAELALFHEIPYGKDEVGLISDEVLFPVLETKLAGISDDLVNGDLFDGGLLLSDFEMEVSDACITSSPRFPYPTGQFTGIANSDENPACCKLLADSEYVGFKYNLFQTAK
jgi:hypothetical protein